MKKMQNLYVLTYQEKNEFRYGGHSTNVHDLTDIGFLKSKRPSSENHCIKVFQYCPEDVREDHLIWLQINDDTNEIVGIETSFDLVKSNDIVSGYRYVGERLTIDNMGMLWK